MSEIVDVTFLISDLSGYTALTEAHGDFHAAKVIHRYLELSDVILSESIKRIERVGDELLFIADAPADAVRAAVQLREIIESEPMFPTVRCGIHRGTVVKQEGSYYGVALNLTSRIAGHARSGQILCSKQVVDNGLDLPDIIYNPLGPIRFKNIPDPVMVYEVLSGTHKVIDVSIDPVCQMLVASDTAIAKFTFESMVYYFCSMECARRFTERPEDYIRH